jgi:hypothetical protein
MSEFLQQIPSIVGPASVMMGVYYWGRRGQRQTLERRSRR